MYHKMMGGRIRLKSHVVPHKFACQGRLAHTTAYICNRAALKRKRVLADVLHNSLDITASGTEQGQSGNVLRILKSWQVVPGLIL